MKNLCLPWSRKETVGVQSVGLKELLLAFDTLAGVITKIGSFLRESWRSQASI